ncbi:MAG TPA: hypothetical protein VMM93_11860 [Vicinamibacterales bacterium]|nr:hypothetical protein [Vicinamibacterales bacterium]
MKKSIFVNLPVKDLAAATRFYEAIGCKKNDQFSDDKAASMVWSDTITFQLLAREYFATFTPKPVADVRNSCAVLLALPLETRALVDTFADAADAAGGHADVRDRMDLGWLYNRAVEDPDGHLLEALWMDSSGMAESDTVPRG